MRPQHPAGQSHGTLLGRCPGAPWRPAGTLPWLVHLNVHVAGDPPWPLQMALDSLKGRGYKPFVLKDLVGVHFSREQAAMLSYHLALR